MKKHTFLLFIVSLLSYSTFSQTKLTSEINGVTVFKKNAQITRQANTTIKPGSQEIILTGISTYVNPSSLQVQFNNPNVVLLSASYENNNSKPKVKNQEIKDLENELDILHEELASNNDKRASLYTMESMLNNHRSLDNGESKFTAQEVTQLIDAYEIKYLEIKKKLRIITKKEQPLREKITKVQKQLNELNTTFNHPSGQIKLKVSAKNANQVAIRCKYIVNNSGWSPLYDIRSESIKTNVHLNYKANIYQNTGVDWKSIPVIVSTGNPSRNNNRPILSPLYTNIEQPVNQYKMEESLDEIVVAPSSNMMKKSTTGFVQATALPPAQVSENQLSVEFNISNKQTINSDGKENLVQLKSYELTTEYIYHSVPKLNKGAFLLARISNWSQFNLSPGNANVFFEGAFIGKTYINSATTSDRLLISMGLDDSIVVERNPIKEFTASKSIGTNKKETIGYELIIKNKKSIPIKIELLDQVPISQNKLIQIELEEKGSAEFSEDIGKLLWSLDISPRTTKKEKFIYTVKYPKKESITRFK